MFTSLKPNSLSKKKKNERRKEEEEEEEERKKRKEITLSDQLSLFFTDQLVPFPSFP